MKILLVNPINRTYVIMPSLGLGYLASTVRNRHSVTILDCKKEKMTYRNFSDYIKDNEFDLIGFQFFSYDVNSVKRHIEIIKEIKHKRRITIIAGGPHPSGLPDATLDYLPDLDFAFKGESEIGFAKFVDFLDSYGYDNIKNRYDELRGIPGLIFRNGEGKSTLNEPLFVDNLDLINFPSWDLIDPTSYPESPHGAFARSFPTAPMIITRGCPSLCTFCAGKAINGPRIRKRSIDNVWTEVQYLIERFGIKEILLEDENFTLHKKLLNDFCTRLINSDRKISWSFPSGVRLDTLDVENLKLMEKAGCYSLAVGVEFGSQRIHDLTKKALTIEMIREKLSLLAKTKIKVTGFFLMGIPGETRSEIISTVNLALRLDLGRAHFSNFMPLPGSPLWDSLEKKGMLNNINWNSFFVHDVAFPPDGMSAKELKNIQRSAYIKFYLRPKIIYRIFKEIRSFRHLRSLLNRFRDALS